MTFLHHLPLAAGLAVIAMAFAADALGLGPDR